MPLVIRLRLGLVMVVKVMLLLRIVLVMLLLVMVVMHVARMIDKRRVKVKVGRVVEFARVTVDLSAVMQTAERFRHGSFAWRSTIVRKQSSTFHSVAAEAAVWHRRRIGTRPHRRGTGSEQKHQLCRVRRIVIGRVFERRFVRRTARRSVRPFRLWRRSPWRRVCRGSTRQSAQDVGSADERIECRVLLPSSVALFRRILLLSDRVLLKLGI